jgi:hypothetical protein
MGADSAGDDARRDRRAIPTPAAIGRAQWRAFGT